MEYAKENAKCIQCEGNKELYASQCRHLDPICITCATNMAKDKTPCPTCHQVFTKIFRQYKLKPCPDGDTNKFLAKFPPKLSDSADFMGAEKQNADNKYFRKSDKRKWIMYREGAEDKRNKSKIATRPWILENVMDKKKYKGKAKPVDNKMYYMVQFDYKRMSEPLVVYPIKSWYEFETEIQYKTLTTEEAENIMKSRKKNEEGYAKWISNEKMKKDEMEDVDENDETRKQKQLKKEDDSDQDEEEKKSNPDENDLPKGEDWEHEEEFTDDDLSASSEASESEGVPSDMSDFENEKVTESGAEMKNILKKEKLGENDVHEEKAQNNDASNSVNEKDCSDGKNKRKDREEQEMTEVKNSEKAKVEQRNKRKKTGEGKPQESEAHRPPVEQRNGKRKANEGKSRESEAHRPPIEERHGKRKANEGKPQEPEAHRAHKKAKAASEGKSQESGAQKKVNDKASFEKLAREFLQQGPRDDKEMKSFMSQHAKGMKQEDIVAVLKLVSKKDKTTGKFMLRR